MRNKSVLQEAQDIQKAVDLIRLGARMQMLEAETSLRACESSAHPRAGRRERDGCRCERHEMCGA